MGAPSPAIMAILGVDAGTSRKPGCSVYVARSNAAPRHADTGPGTASYSGDDGNGRCCNRIVVGQCLTVAVEDEPVRIEGVAITHVANGDVSAERCYLPVRLVRGGDHRITHGVTVCRISSGAAGLARHADAAANDR